MLASSDSCLPLGMSKTCQNYWETVSEVITNYLLASFTHDLKPYMENKCHSYICTGTCVLNLNKTCAHPWCYAVQESPARDQGVLNYIVLYCIDTEAGTFEWAIPRSLLYKYYYYKKSMTKRR